MSAKLISILTLTTLLIIGCADDVEFPDAMISPIDFETAQLADPNATQDLVDFRNKLVEVSYKGVAFGHQDATAYGFNWVHSGFPSTSDVFQVSGDFPAVVGFDLGRIELGRRANINSINFELMKELIQEAHESGSIITLSWHAANPINRGSPWNLNGLINRILPTGDRHDILEAYVSQVADFINDLTDAEGKAIPVIFRPWHETNGHWFWWGNETLTSEESKELYRSTVDLLVNTNDVHNVLFAYSPNCALSEEEYLSYYPGDEYVDLLGVDVYDFQDENFVDIATTSLETIARLGAIKNKPFAFTETGLENIRENDWWTNKLYPVLQNTGASYVMLWRNDEKVHWYVPFIGQASEENFKSFISRPDILLRSDI